jgi:RecB family exonuclease
MRLEHLGVDTLSAFYERKLSGSAPHIHKVEHTLNFRLDDVPLKGKLDRIDLAGPDDARATIYDYKTGKPKAPAEIEKLGYTRQLIFYDLLVRGAMPYLRPQAYILCFVGEDGEEAIERTYSFTDEDRRELSALIREVWKKIVALDF